LDVDEVSHSAMRRIAAGLTAGMIVGATMGRAQVPAPVPPVVVLHSLPGGDGSAPNTPLLAVGNDYYGTTLGGGQFGWGTIFRISRTGAFALLYSFRGLGDGGRPLGLVLGPDGAVYGTTRAIPRRSGQPDIWGTFFRIAPSGALTTLYVFRRFEDGYRPGPIALARDGFFYGSTQTGGVHGYGTRFRLSTKGDLTVVRAFTSADNGGLLSVPGPKPPTNVRIKPGAN